MINAIIIKAQKRIICRLSILSNNAKIDESLVRNTCVSAMSSITQANPITIENILLKGCLITQYHLFCTEFVFFASDFKVLPVVIDYMIS